MLGFAPVEGSEADDLMRELEKLGIDCVKRISESTRLAGVLFVFGAERPLEAFASAGIEVIDVAINQTEMVWHTADLWVNVAGGPERESARCHVHRLWEDHSSAVECVVNEFASTIDRPVVVTRPCLSRSLAGTGAADGVFWVYINDHQHELQGRRADEAIQEVFDISLRRREQPLLASGQGIEVLDPSTGSCVAEVFEGRLYIHFRLGKYDAQFEIDILEKILKEAAQQILNRGGDPDPAEVERRFVRLCDATYHRVVAKTKSQLVKDEVRVEELKRELAATAARIEARRLKLRELEVLAPKTEERAVNYETLTTHPMASTVTVKSGVLEVTTPCLYGQDPRTGVIYRLGAQTITIHPNGKNGGVRYHCNDGNISGTGRALPHADQDGSIAHPEALEAVAELTAFGDLATLFDVAVQAATTIDTEHHLGGDINKWPRATPEELVGTEWEGQQVNQAA